MVSVDPSAISIGVFKGQTLSLNTPHELVHPESATTGMKTNREDRQDKMGENNHIIYLCRYNPPATPKAKGRYYKDIPTLTSISHVELVQRKVKYLPSDVSPCKGATAGAGPG